MAATVTQTPAPEKPAPNSGKPLEGLQNRPEDTSPLKGNPYFPRFGSQAAHDEFVSFLRESFLAKQMGDMALRMAKAMHKFVNAMLGTGGVRKSPMEPPVNPIHVNDLDFVQEYDPKSTCLAADWKSHYDLIAEQARQSAQSVHS